MLSRPRQGKKDVNKWVFNMFIILINSTSALKYFKLIAHHSGIGYGGDRSGGSGYDRD